MYAMIMDPHLPSIYPSFVSIYIYTIRLDPSWVLSIWDFQDPKHGSTLVPYFKGRILEVYPLKFRPKKIGLVYGR